MGESANAAVIDNGTGVYFWDNDPRVLEEFVFMGVFRCEQCGRSVTVVRFAGDDYTHDRAFRRQKHCPGGCEAVHEWLAAI
jgi:hypothetical protein